MDNNILFFDKFFACNNERVGNNFLKAMNLPKEVETFLREYYIEHLEQKEIADKHNLDERTVRNRLSMARDICRLKAVAFFSTYFSNTDKLPD